MSYNVGVFVVVVGVVVVVVVVVMVDVGVETREQGSLADPPGILASRNVELPGASETRRIRSTEPPTDTILNTFVTSSLQSLQPSNSRVSEPRRPSFFKRPHPDP